jgi:Uma2 family endonuclease
MEATMEMPVAPQPQKRRYTLEEYFEMEYKSETRHEYYDGDIVEMAYTSEPHGIIVHNLDRLLGNCLVDNDDCIVIPNDRMVYVPVCNKVFYPDLLIVCGERQYYAYSINMRATLNPSVLIEVLSDSNEDNDIEGEKAKCYRRIPSLKQYVLVHQKEKFIEIREKEENGRWYSDYYYLEAGEEDLELTIGDCKISFNAIYRKVVFAEF